MAGKYVINGAKIKCPLCTKPEGKLMVTSNAVGVQGKFWATDADKGKPNLLFQGNCTKFTNNPPPCAGVIAPIQWQNTALGMKVNGNAPLLESSSIMCATGGVPISIADTTQRAVPTNLQSMAESGAPVPAPEETTEPEIIDAYWVDKDMNKETTLDFGEKARIRIKSENAQGKKIVVRVYESDFGPLNDDFIWEHDWTLENSDAILSFNITPNMFIKGEEGFVHFYFTLQVEGLDEEEFCNNDSEYLIVYLVRYIPKIMLEQNPPWSNGAKIMNQWFSREPNAISKKGVPDTTSIKMDWVLNFDRIKQFYQKNIINQNFYLDDSNVLTQLKKEIKKMLSDKELLMTLPERIGDSINFGDFSQKIIKNSKGDYNTITHKYYVKNVPWGSSYYSDSYSSGSSYKPYGDTSDQVINLDDFIATIGRAVFRISFFGKITKTNENDFTINILKAGVFLRDSFSFEGEERWHKPEQPLGYWNPSTNYVGTNPLYGYYITNEDFRNYRDTFNKGGDFLIFSDVKSYDVNKIIQVKKNELK